MKKYEFVNNGEQLVINTPLTPRSWSNYLFNHEYYTEVSQTLQGKSICLDPVEREFTKGYRYFYIKDKTNNKIFSVNYTPKHEEYDKFECIHGLTYTELITEKHGIESRIKIFVPVEGTYEFISWTVSCNDDRDVELCSCIGIEHNGMGVICEYEDNVFSSMLFPYHIKYDEYNFADSQKRYSFCISSKPADRHIGCEFGFFGSDDKYGIPSFLSSEIHSNDVHGDTPPVFAECFDASIGSNKNFSVNFMVGVAHDKNEIYQIKETTGSFDEEFNKVNKLFEDSKNSVVFDSPDTELNIMLNNWIKKQTLCMAQTHRKTIFVCTRNELQDAVGLAILNPQEAIEQVVKVFEEQYEDGYLQQHHTYNDVLPPQKLGVLKHMDGVVWLILCTCFVINETGDKNILQRCVKYKKSEKVDTIYNHIVAGIKFMGKNVGVHNLCLLGDGDWTDPINGAGRFGKGESVWTTMGYLSALKEFSRFADELEVSRINEQINIFEGALEKYAWIDDRFIAGYDDDGNTFGGSENNEGNLFLNPQTWSIISGVMNSERLEKYYENLKKLKTPFGYKLLYPPYSKWDAQVGKISVKSAGTTENGSVYNHATMFKLYADFLLNDNDEAYRTLKSVLPTNPGNPPEHNLQIPIYLTNYYYGVENESYGKSSCVNYTGTCSWMLWLATNYMFGAKATVDGIVLEPHLPEVLKSAEITRKYRNSTYIIRIEKNDNKRIVVDGKEINSTLLPYENGKVYNVVCYI